ncbi:nucleotidyltransferase domain-containing protein [Filibacter tadaridae]|uniref:Nucleotidyltransferase domain protein n=1 Tax=Filibacter tadaridae TaxID=2483811 RepID=A0A3P5XCW3_9BACL|nr:nucleotidyltransferase domain-containing protein [Filibacter tadaridae]VDC32501.1 Nucleotidyltransferase domain protein [Filibacter tadaridae]
MTTHTELREQILSELRSIINTTLSDLDVKVYLFGSWARNEEKQSSDIDIAVESCSQLPPSKWLELHENIEESIIPYNVDIVNLENASSALIQNVKREGVIWIDSKNE